MKWKFWVGILISVVCLYVVFRGIEWGEVLVTLQSANYVYLAIAALLNLSTIWLRAERWKYLLEPIKQLTFLQLVPATMIGFMANNILPARAGEFIRAYLLGTKEDIKKTAAFATIILERVCDMVTVLVFLVIVLLTVKFPQTPDAAGSNSLSSLFSPALMQKAGILSVIFVAGLVGFLVLLKEFPQATTRIVRLCLTPFPEALHHKVIELLESFREGLQVLKTGTHLLYLIFWSLIVWLAICGGGWFVLLAFGLDVPFLTAIFIVVLVAFAVAVPSSPGYVGPFHAAVLAGVLLFQPALDKGAVAGIAIVYHLMAIGPITLGGVYYLWKEQMSFADIRHIEEEDHTEYTARTEPAPPAQHTQDG
jgi:glycosyltransferase 2 family protein